MRKQHQEERDQGDHSKEDLEETHLKRCLVAEWAWVVASMMYMLFDASFFIVVL
jgi:hypothetical protein